NLVQSLVNRSAGEQPLLERRQCRVLVTADTLVAGLLLLRCGAHDSPSVPREFTPEAGQVVNVGERQEHLLLDIHRLADSIPGNTELLFTPGIRINILSH